MFSIDLCAGHARSNKAQAKGSSCLLLPLPCLPHATRDGEPRPEPSALVALVRYEGDHPVQLSDRPSPGLNEKTTSHNTHKILMCLQNYLIFYLEVIPPLSSFIALYVTGVGSSAKWGHGGGGAEGVFTADFGKAAGPRGPSLRPSPPHPACSIWRRLVHTGFPFILSFQTWILLYF